MQHSTTQQMNWNLIQRFLFRFFLIYFILYIPPAIRLRLGFINEVTKYIDVFTNWMVVFSNDHIFKLFDKLVPTNGSGDTSWNWIQLLMNISLAFIIASAWTGFFRKKDVTKKVFYFFTLLLRFSLVRILLGYGFSKLFALQMAYPNLSQMAMTLGELNPMHLAWIFFGYSEPYQIFSGMMEVLAALLLLYRRTTPAGALLGFIVMVNVVLLNLSYDIVVKLFSTHLAIMALILIVFDSKRIFAFFILNKAATPSLIYDPPFKERWFKISRVILKCLFVLLTIILPLFRITKAYNQIKHPPQTTSIPIGYYDVLKFAVNKDTLAPKVADSTRWENMIFDRGGEGSMISSDTLFEKMNGRTFFHYSEDTAKHQLLFKKSQADTIILSKMNFIRPDSMNLILKGKIRNDSIYLHLRKNNKEYRLTQRPFNWLSESPRY
jgi:hypothetical protein